jgi:hypothetical protein
MTTCRYCHHTIIHISDFGGMWVHKADSHANCVQTLADPEEEEED